MERIKLKNWLSYLLNNKILLEKAIANTKLTWSNVYIIPDEEEIAKIIIAEECYGYNIAVSANHTVENLEQKISKLFQFISDFERSREIDAIDYIDYDEEMYNLGRAEIIVYLYTKNEKSWNKEVFIQDIKSNKKVSSGVVPEELLFQKIYKMLNSHDYSWRYSVKFKINI